VKVLPGGVISTILSFEKSIVRGELKSDCAGKSGKERLTAAKREGGTGEWMVNATREGPFRSLPHSREGESLMRMRRVVSL